MLRYQEAVLEFSASSVDAVAPPASAGRGVNSRSSRPSGLGPSRSVLRTAAPKCLGVRVFGGLPGGLKPELNFEWTPRRGFQHSRRVRQTISDA